MTRPDRKFGVCVFDRSDEKDRKWERHGTACFNGGPLIRFNGFHELDSSIIWVTNQPLWDLAQITGSRSNLRCDCFLTTPLMQLFYDVGASKEPGDIDRVMPTISRIVTNAVIWLEKCYPDIDFGDGSTLKKILFEKVFVRNLNEFLSYPEDLQKAVSDATQRLTKLGASGKRKPRTYAVRSNLTNHVEEVFATRLPSGPVSLIRPEKGRAQNDLTRALMEEDRFYVANVMLRGEKSPMAVLAGFGQASVLNAEPRVWVTGVELCCLHELYEIEVRSYYLWEKSNDIPPDRDIPSLLLHDRLDRLTYSNQLASLAILAAATEPLPNRDRMAKGGVNRYSAQSMVLSARDRTLTMLMAAELGARGFNPYLYKNGQVFVEVNNARFDELNELIDEKGWSFPVRENLNKFLLASKT